MWMIGLEGFYSVVQHRKKKNHVLVRARVRQDLVRLKRFIPGMKIQRTYRADYPFRALVTKKQLANAAQRMVLEIDYDNFKSAVTKKFGHERSDVYMRIWSALHGLHATMTRILRWKAFQKRDGVVRLTQQPGLFLDLEVDDDEEKQDKKKEPESFVYEQLYSDDFLSSIVREDD
jgi:hypothetical protein